MHGHFDTTIVKTSNVANFSYRLLSTIVIIFIVATCFVYAINVKTIAPLIASQTLLAVELKTQLVHGHFHTKIVKTFNIVL